MVVATLVMFLIMSIAQHLGQGLTGLVSPFPVFGAILVVFAQRQLGKTDAQRLPRGVALSSFAFAVFFFAVSALLVQTGGALTYSIAAFFSLSMNAVLFASFGSRM
jgi:hypothetical protein